jgi:hypothetical protein
VAVGGEPAGARELLARSRLVAREHGGTELSTACAV